MDGKISDMRRKPSGKLWLLTLTGNEVLRLAMLKGSLRKKRNNGSSKPQQKSNHILQQVANYQPQDRLKE
jgi:hypothetical protein